MKKLITLFAAFHLAVGTADACNPIMTLDLVAAAPYVNISGTGGTSPIFNLFADGWAPDCNGSSVYFKLTLKLKNDVGTTVYSQTYNPSVGSYQTTTICDPTPGSLCPYGYGYLINVYPGVPYMAQFNIPNQSCGQYTVEAEISNVNLNNAPSTRTISTTNVGGGTSSCPLNSGGSCSLGSIMIVNFSGTGSLAASMSSSIACGGNNGTATITPSGGSTPYTYSWMGSASTSGTATSLAPGTYTATATDANGCAVSGTTTVGHLSFTLTPGSQTVCADKCLLLEATVSSSGSYTVTWTQSIGGGSPATIGTGNEICVRPTSLWRTTPTANTYTATVTNGLGCTLTQSITITVNPNCTVSYYNGCCTDPDARVASTNVNPESTSLSISPNPAAAETNIAFSLPAGNGSIEIYSTDGRLVQRIDDIHDSGTVQLMTGEFAPGVYSVILVSGDQQVRTEKLVIAE